jgi:hypothetical protein
MNLSPHRRYQTELKAWAGLSAACLQSRLAHIAFSFATQKTSGRMRMYADAADAEGRVSRKSLPQDGVALRCRYHDISQS